MIQKKTILVETELVDDHWTTGTVAAIDQAGFLAGCLQSEIHLLSNTGSNTGASSKPSDCSPALLERLHKETASALEKVGVGMTSPFIHEASSRCPTGQPAPLSFVFLSLPDLIDESQAGHRNQVLSECRNDLWLAAPQAFDPEIPCVAVYDDLTSNGELSLRAAVSVAQNLQARLLVVHAGSDESASSESGGKTKDELEAILFSRLFGTDFRTLDQGTRLFVENGTAGDVLNQAVQEFESSLVVVNWPDGPIHAESLPNLMTTLNQQHCSLLLVRTPETVESLPEV